MELTTSRLLMRDWKDSDREPFAALCADPVVMEHFPKPLTREESDAFVDLMQKRLDQNGYGLWATELLVNGEFIGFIGLNPVPEALPAAPGVEVGWRLARPYWGLGLAPEGARAAVDYAFDEVGLDEIVSFTTTKNLRSQRVMEKLGMTRDPADDFDHPALPTWPERRHCLYRLARA